MDVQKQGKTVHLEGQQGTKEKEFCAIAGWSPGSF